MSAPLALALMAGLALSSVGCSEGELPEVWIASAAPSSAPVGGVVVLSGDGFGTAQVVDENAARDLDQATDQALSDGVVFEGVDAVTVGGKDARVFLRQNQRVDLEIPDLPAGPAFVVVWTQGVASNAFVVRVLPTAQSATP